MANRIRELREAAGLSLAQVATSIFGNEIDVKTVSSQIAKIERSETMLTLLWMQRIAGALGVTAADLLAAEDNPYQTSATERRLIADFRTMPTPLRAKAAGIISLLAAPDPA